jgi:hypothetical protein
MFSRSTWIAVLGFFACLNATSILAQATSFQFLQRPGPYTVGLKVIDQYDPSRIFPSPSDSSGNPPTTNSSRPLQTLIWYPSAGSTAKK